MILRPAELADSTFLYILRNEPAARENSWSKRVISPATHQRWLAAALKDSRRRVYIAIDTLAVEPIGTGRLHLDGSGDVELSIALIPAARGHGHGTDLVRALVDEAKDMPTRYAVAKIRACNAASIIAFVRTGFQPWEMQDGPRGDWIVVRRRLR